MIDVAVLPLLVAFVLAELAAAFVAVPLGAALHAVVVVVASQRYVVASGRDRGGRLLAVLALLSATRLVAMAIPLTAASVAVRAAMAGAPAVAGALVLLRVARDSQPPMPARRARRLATLAAVGVAAGPLGLLAAAAQHFRTPVFVHPVIGYPVTAVSLALFSAAAEELGFRRLLIPAAREALGRRGAWAASVALFAATYLGSRSAAVVAVAVAGGVVFTWGYVRSRSAIVPVVGHAVATVGAFLIWPGLLR